MKGTIDAQAMTHTAKLLQMLISDLQGLYITSDKGSDISQRE